MTIRGSRRGESGGSHRRGRMFIKVQSSAAQLQRYAAGMTDQARNNSETQVNTKAIGCSFVFMGALGAILGLGGLLGIIKNLGLEFFGIELNDQKGRVYWIIGCLAFSIAGIFIMKLNKKRANKSLETDPPTADS